MVIRGPDSLVIKKWILVLLVLALLLSFSMLIVISVQHYQVLAKVAQIHRHNSSGDVKSNPESNGIGPRGHVPPYRFGQNLVKTKTQDGVTSTSSGIDEEVTASLNVD